MFNDYEVYFMGLKMKIGEKKILWFEKGKKVLVPQGVAINCSEMIQREDGTTVCMAECRLFFSEELDSFSLK